MVIVVSVVLFFLVSQQRFAEAAKIRGSINQYQSMLEEKERRVRNLAQEKRDLQDLVTSYEKVRKSFFHYNEAIDFVINDLTDMVKSNTLNYTALNLKPIKPIDDKLSDFSVALDVEGDYGNVRKFIFDIENSDRAMYLDDFNLMAKTVDPVKVGTSLVLHLFVLSNPETKGQL